LGIAIIVVTIIIRIILYPLAKKSLQSQRALKKIQPEIKKVQKEFAKNKEQQTQEMMKLYKKHKVNPLSGCLPLIIQLPILIALYRVFINGFNGFESSQLYSFVASPGELNTTFLGVINLAEKNIMLALIAGAVQFVYTKLTIANSKKDDKKEDKEEKDDKKAGPFKDMGEIMNKQMLYFMPLLTVFIGISFPAGLPLYWIISTLFSVGQYYILDWEEKKKEAKKA